MLKYEVIKFGMNQLSITDSTLNKNSRELSFINFVEGDDKSEDPLSEYPFAENTQERHLILLKMSMV